MGGTVLGSAGTPLSPWHAAQSCAFASISSAACAGGTASARPIPIPKIAEKKRVCMTRFLPLPRGAKVWQDRSEEHTSELQSHSDLVCRLLLEKKKDEMATGASAFRKGPPENSADVDPIIAHNGDGSKPGLQVVGNVLNSDRHISNIRAVQ